MAKEKRNLRDELREYKFEFGLLQKIPCSKQDNQRCQKILNDKGVLPEGIYAYEYDTGDSSTTEFYTIYQPDLTDAEIVEYLTYKKLSLIKTIKNCAVSFTVLTIIGLVGSFFIMTGAF